MKIRNLPKEFVLPIKFDSNNIDNPFLFETNDSQFKQFNVFQTVVKQLNDRQFKKYRLNSGFLELNFSVKSFINADIDDIYDLFLDFFILFQTNKMKIILLFLVNLIKMMFILKRIKTIIYLFVVFFLLIQCKKLIQIMKIIL